MGMLKLSTLAQQIFPSSLQLLEPPWGLLDALQDWQDSSSLQNQQPRKVSLCSIPGKFEGTCKGKKIERKSMKE